MAGTVPIPLTSLPDGQRLFGPVNIADGDTLAVLSIDRTITGGLNSLTPATMIAAAVEESADNGVTWFPLVEGIWSGGVPVNPFRGNTTTAGMGAYYAPGTARRTRARM